MPTFTIHQRGSIRGIPGVGVPKQFQPGDTYETIDSGEMVILRLRPDYVATEILEDGELNEPVAPIEPAVFASPEPTELQIAQGRRAFKDELITTSQRKLWDRAFPDGSLYKTVWKQGMKKAEFVNKILETLDSG